MLQSNVLKIIMQKHKGIDRNKWKFMLKSWAQYELGLAFFKVLFLAFLVVRIAFLGTSFFF